jgi:hypothetical protein
MAPKKKKNVAPKEKEEKGKESTNDEDTVPEIVLRNPNLKIKTKRELVSCVIQDKAFEDLLNCQTPISIQKMEKEEESTPSSLQDTKDDTHPSKTSIGQKLDNFIAWLIG